MPSWKPDDYSSVSPYLVVDGAQRLLAFLEATFGATPLRRYDRPGGDAIIHAEVRIGDSVVMVADAAEGWPAVPAHVHVYVEDVDATFRRALDAGGEAVQEPVRKEDPDKRGGVRGPGGVTWWIATQEGV